MTLCDVSWPLCSLNDINENIILFWMLSWLSLHLILWQILFNWFNALFKTPNKKVFLQNNTAVNVSSLFWLCVKLWAVSTVKFCSNLLCTVEISNQIWGLFNWQLEILALINISIRIASSTLKSCCQDAEGKILMNKESYCTQIKWITT